MFSSRVPGDLTPNALTVALKAIRARGEAVLDLTASNPTRAGFDYPTDLLTPLADARGLAYSPEPLGLRHARQAVAAEFARRGRRVDPDTLALTASTSEAYSLLFKVLCNAGDEVLIPRPSYPLFEHLTQLDLVTGVSYDLEYHAGWTIDLAALEAAVTPRTRAVLVVSPNNPTGNFISPAELSRLADLCAARNIAVISDEVFADYPLGGIRCERAGRLTDRHDVLGFTLGGLSKAIGLPQAKLAWIAISGPDAVVREARSRLELICDTYLSVSTPLQDALGDLLTRGQAVREQILARITANHRALQSASRSVPACDLLQADGGWYAVLRVPSLMSEDDLVLSLLSEDRVLVHPGYFFDFQHESFLIVSLLPPAEVFLQGTSRILNRFASVRDPR